MHNQEENWSNQDPQFAAGQKDEDRKRKRNGFEKKREKKKGNIT